MTTQHPALPAIELPQLRRDGIGAHAARQLDVLIRPFPGMEAGDLIEVFWDKRFVSALILEPRHVAHDLRIRVPEGFIHSGMARLRYQVLRAGEQRLHSPVTLVMVKLERPGGVCRSAVKGENTHLAPLRFPAAIRRFGVNLGAHRSGVPFTVPTYPNMAAGDEITLRWGDERHDLPRVRPDQVGQPLVGLLPYALLRRAGNDSSMAISWCVIDRVGNSSQWAPLQHLRVWGARTEPLFAF